MAVLLAVKGALRFDMSEYMESTRWHACWARRRAMRLRRGRAADGGRAPPPVQRVLLDEIEGTPDVANILLQVMENGALTDSEAACGLHPRW
ncbi:MAG: AAA family ATPase [Ruthenibacterium lactatiformans]